MQNFFEHQDQARRNTRLLVLLMGLGVLGLGLSVYALLRLIMRWGGARQELVLTPAWDLRLLAGCVLGTLLLVVLASAYRTVSLRGGGARVAEMLGGRLINGSPHDPLERRLRNVVEEMAIASGVPVPQVFVLDDEPGINAFAAGFSIDDAAIGVTRGTLEKLTRDELQGVVAHEFSHVFNGDMRLNLRLLGVLFGIVVIGSMGRLLIHLAAHSRVGSRRKSGGGILAAAFVLGIGLFLIGTLGELFAKLIKAAVSRQREFLADASAVQFTRNPSGIAGALKKIGGYSEHARVRIPAADEAAHFFFGDIRTRSFTQAFLGTHPRLADRIARVDPSFTGEFPEVAEGIVQPDEPGAGAAAGMVSSMHAGGRGAGVPGERATTPGAQGATMSGAASWRDTLQPVSAGQAIEGIDLHAGAAPSAQAVLDSVGTASSTALERGHDLLAELPEALREAAHSPFSACAIVYALLLSQNDEAQRVQRQKLDTLAGARLHAETLRMQLLVGKLPRRSRLPLVELLAPALRELSSPQRATFTRALQAMIDADQAVSVFEYVVIEMLRARLAGEARAGARARARIATLTPVRGELQLLLSLLAHTGALEQDGAQRAFAAGSARLSGVALELLPSSTRLLSALGPALHTLATLAPLPKQQVVDACAHAVLADHRVTDDEATLLQAVCDALGAPLPVE